VTSQGQRFRRRALRRGYKVDEVDAFLDRVEATLAGESMGAPVAAQEVHDVVFRVRFGGYDEWQVDLHLDRVERQLGDVEERSGGFQRNPDRSGLRDDRLRDEPLEPRRPSLPPPMPMRPLTPMPAGAQMSGPPTFGGQMMPPPPMSAPPLSARPMSAPPMRPMSGPPLRPMSGPPMPVPAYGMGGPGMGGAGMGGAGMGGPGMGVPGMGVPGMGSPGMGVPGMGNPGMGGPGFGQAPGGGLGSANGGYPSRFDDTDYPGGYGNDFGGRRGRTDMTHEMRFDLNGSVPTSGGPASQSELQRIDSLRRTFTARRFGSGYDAIQVNRLFDAIIASLSGRSGMPLNEAELDPNQFSLVPGGYFEAEVNQALREIRELVRR